MSTLFETSCDGCTWTSRHTTRDDADQAATLHACGPRVCQGCGGGYRVLVEGTDMCLACDIRYYPDTFPTTHRRVA